MWEPIGGARDALKLGYRRGARGGASWMAKARVSGTVHQARIGDADDIEQGQGFSYTDAIAAAGRWRDGPAIRLTGEKPARDGSLRGCPRGASVRGHVETYLSRREAEKGKASASNARQRLGAHVLADAIADLKSRRSPPQTSERGGAATQDDPRWLRAHRTYVARDREKAAGRLQGGAGTKPDGRGAEGVGSAGRFRLRQPASCRTGLRGDRRR